MKEILDKITAAKYLPSQGDTTYKCASNIALIKYWGKFEKQIPANPSLSFTLKNSHTITSLQYAPIEKLEKVSIEFEFEGKQNDAFKLRIEKYLNGLTDFLPMLLDHHLVISSKNSFPHSSGIASSASSMAALAMNLTDMLGNLYGGVLNPEEEQRFASNLARLGSGSACRSVYPGFSMWGKSEFYENSSDLFAIPLESEKIHKTFTALNDDILIIEEGAKTVSSSAGHGLMNGHPFAETRFDLARKRIGELSDILEKGAFEEFGQLIENEALMLHGLMMTSNPSYILFKPNTLAAIEAIWKFREATKTPLYFTLDAGANLHLIYPYDNQLEVRSFMDSDLVVYCENGTYLCDQLGLGPEKIK